MKCDQDYDDDDDDRDDDDDDDGNDNDDDYDGIDDLRHWTQKISDKSKPQGG